MSADEFARDFLPERFRHQHSILASKQMPETTSPESELRSRQWMLKGGEFGYKRSGWELLLALVHDWTQGTENHAHGLAR